jgi:hypothetical protein
LIWLSSVDRFAVEEYLMTRGSLRGELSGRRRPEEIKPELFAYRGTSIADVASVIDAR